MVRHGDGAALVQMLYFRLVALARFFNGKTADRPIREAGVPQPGRGTDGDDVKLIPETLLESELFGYKKGAFTGAIKDKMGFLEASHGGTLFLDEVGELPLSLQVKLLRMVQEKTFTPVGGTDEIKVDGQELLVIREDDIIAII